jgi:hypothetical protein
MPRAGPVAIARGRESYQVGCSMQMPGTLFGSIIAKQLRFARRLWPAGAGHVHAQRNIASAFEKNHLKILGYEHTC